jgi:hypothetical protein
MNLLEDDNKPSTEELAQIMLIFDRKLKILENRISEIETQINLSSEVKETSKSEEYMVNDKKTSKIVYTKQDILSLKPLINAEDRLSMVRNEYAGSKKKSPRKKNLEEFKNNKTINNVSPDRYHIHESGSFRIEIPF